MPANFDRRRADTSGDRSLSVIFAAFLFSRLISNMLIRLPFVFETSIHRGLGVSLTTVVAVLGLRELVGLLSPAVGALSDSGHQNRLVVGGVALAGAVTVGAGMTTEIYLWSALIIVGGLGKTAAEVAQHSFVGHHVRFATRGRVAGVIELSWAGAYLIGAPLVALLINLGDWQLPFLVLGGVLLVAAWLNALALRRAPPAPDSSLDSADPEPHSFPDTKTLTRGRGPTSRTLGLWLLMVFHPLTQMLIFAIHGDWFVTDLGMSTSWVGRATLLVGAGEMLGTTAALAYSDRAGKRRLSRAGMAASVPLIWSLGFLDGHVPLAVAVLVAAALCLEVAFVSALPMFSEIDPRRRGNSVARIFVVMTVVRAVAAPVAGWVYEAGGMPVIAAAAAVSALCGAVATSPRLLSIGEE